MKSVLFICMILSVMSARAQDKITLVEVASGFTIPIGMAHAGDERLFIVEKNGTIRIMDTTGQVIQDPFLDIDAKVNSAASERGLLGLAFHPSFAENGYFFVNYTNNAGNTVVARYRRDSTEMNLADPTSELILMTVTQPFTNHNGGHLAFGPDGYLYIGLGDGGSGGDPGDRAQNGQERLGKMMRVDVDNETPYAIPADNPFVGNDTILEEIWALGLRNPWRYSFDRLTGDLWIGDVGQDAWEEIDFQPAASTGGENYGWRCKEGLVNFNTSGCPSPDVFTDPVFVYAHSGQNCSGSVTGGYVYRGTMNPYLLGKYVFTDYCNGIFRALQRDQEGNIESEELANLQNQQFATFGEDASGELYVAAASGTIYRIEDLVSAVADLSSSNESIMPNPASHNFRIQSDVKSLLTYAVFDVRGNSILSGETYADREVNCSRLPEGVYVVEWSADNHTRQIGKLIIMR